MSFNWGDDDNIPPEDWYLHDARSERPRTRRERVIDTILWVVFLLVIAAVVMIGLHPQWNL